MLREFFRQATRWHRIESSFGKQRAASTKAVRLSFKDKCRSIQQKLIYLYGEEQGKESYKKIERKINAFLKKKPKKLKLRDSHFTPRNRFTEKDAVFITYPDSIQQRGEHPLVTLKKACEKYLEGFNTIHLLPFYPSSSDRGFSVINYKKVDPRFGTWEDVEALSSSFNLMFDGIFNHCSRRNHWFKRWLKNSAVYKNHFISFEKSNAITPEQLAKITRPRTTTLLTPFKAIRNGERTTLYVWTTFSRDQLDLNWKEPRILLRVVDIIFRYLRHGATIIRLDAINYVWKELGTSCSNLKQAHIIVQLLRDILDLAAPSINLITETNVPHSKNISYLGNGRNEAQMVYNFTLPPLVLYTFYEENTRVLSKWADRLERTSPYSTYFNFLASHDGIGLTPLQRILPKREVKKLVKKARQHGSLVSYKTKNITIKKATTKNKTTKKITIKNKTTKKITIKKITIKKTTIKNKTTINSEKEKKKDREKEEKRAEREKIRAERKDESGKKEGLIREPYELNVTWWSALAKEGDSYNVARYLASWALALSLKGVPGIYVHALFATPNDTAAAKRSGSARDINRKNLSYEKLQKELKKGCGKEVLEGIKKLLKVRSHHPAFHHASEQIILKDNEQVFALLRVNKESGEERVLCLINVTPEEQLFRINFDQYELRTPLFNLLSGKRLFSHTPHSPHLIHEASIHLKPYEVMWLKSGSASKR